MIRAGNGSAGGAWTGSAGGGGFAAAFLGGLAAVAMAIAVAAIAAPTAEAADDCPNAEFRTGPSAKLPDCRAYELVSPADKGANSLQYTKNAPGRTGFPSVDGEHLSYSGITPMADPRTGLPGVYVSDRTGKGWITRPASPADCETPVAAGQVPWVFGTFSDDFSVTAFESPQNCGAEDDVTDVFTTLPDGSRIWASQGPDPKTASVPRTLAGMSGDGAHVLFATSEKLILPLEDGRVMGKGLYDRVGDETIPVGLASDGSLINACGATIAGGPNTPGQVPTDGRAIFFASGSSGSVAGCSPATEHGGQLYARIDHERTVQLSASTRATPDPDGRQLPEFLGATEDGHMVFFASTEMLTDDATPGGGLYRYDLSSVLDGASTGTLTFLSPAVDGNPAAVEDLFGISADGSVVYFRATGVLAAGASTGEDNIYRAVGGQVEFVATWDVGGAIREASASADGSHFVWRDTVPDGTRQVHLYDGSGVTCVSCDPDGDPQTEDALLYGSGSGSVPEPRLAPASFVTDDGRAYFTSPDRLVARDVNDNLDVYEYDDGVLTLISQGTTRSDSRLWGLAAGGRDVFFVTYDSLVAQDYDEGDQDAYTARVGGGFAPAPRERAPCLGDGCQGLSPDGVLAPPIGSLAFRGRTDRGALRRPIRRPTRLVVGKRKRTVRGARGWIRVRVSGRGRVRTFGRGLRRTGRRTDTAGVYRVRVRLGRRARRRLRRGRAMTVRVRLRFVPVRSNARTRAVRVTFRPARAGRGSTSTAARRGTTEGRR